jgi:aspartyl-tRNA(Asn)/glutamyl-tRNA(Gln) amidotransferase subunit A
VEAFTMNTRDRDPRSPLLAAAAQLREREVTSVQLTEKAIDQANRLDRILGTYVTRIDDVALGDAEQADDDFAAGIDRGVMQGIPIGIKDVIAIRDVPTTASSVVDIGWCCDADAGVVSRLRSGGAVITGKLTTTEFGLGTPDPSKPFPLPRNPWDLRTWAGGSSSGAANGVAAGLFPAAIGTDSGGSIRLPAAFCGVTGFKPTYGLVSIAGCLPLAPTLDHVGPIARTAADCAAVLAVIADAPRKMLRPTWHTPSATGRVTKSRATRVKIGVSRAAFHTQEVARDVVECFERAINVLADLGSRMTDVELPYEKHASTAATAMLVSEAYQHHRRALREQWHSYGTAAKYYLSLGAILSPQDYAQARSVRDLARKELVKVFADCDVVAMPTATIGAVQYDESMRVDPTPLERHILTPYWNAVGNPTVAIPIGFTEDGLPLSLQLAGRPFDDFLVLWLAHAYQRATSWHNAMPPV